ncbi:autotransporter outer membrane beta-barrel domain-containing protein [Fusobacterium varium]|uniref:autotransporter outer membrane beta-barrel domain-containing protein n=3 Tax=Fusobacterium varium TaxID=856 RepID=UPI003028647D
MIEKIMKAVKKGNKKRSKNITIGAVIGFLLSCTNIIGAEKEMAGLEIKRENGNLNFTALSGGASPNISVGENINEFYKYNTFKNNVYTNNSAISEKVSSDLQNSYGIKLSLLTENFTIINENVIGVKSEKGSNNIGINISDSAIEFTIKNNGFIYSERGSQTSSGIKIGENITKTNIENEGIISAKVDSPSKAIVKGIENNGKNLEIANHGVIYGDSSEGNGIGIHNKGDNLSLLNSGIIYGDSNVKSNNIAGIYENGANGSIKNTGMIFETSTGNNMSHGIFCTKELDILENDGVIYSIKKSSGNSSSGLTFSTSLSKGEKILNNGIIYGINDDGLNNENLNGYGISNEKKGNISKLINTGIIYGNKYAINNKDIYNSCGKIDSGVNYGLLISGGDEIADESITFVESNGSSNEIENNGLIFTVDENRVYKSKDKYKNNFGTEKTVSINGENYKILNVSATIKSDGEITDYQSLELKNGNNNYDKHILNGVEKTLVIEERGNVVSNSIVNGYDDAIDMKEKSDLKLQNTKVNSYGKAIAMAGNSELTIENSIINGGALGGRNNSNTELPTIGITGDNNKLILEKNSIVNGNYKDKDVINITSVIKVEGDNNEVTLSEGSVVNGKMEASGNGNTLNFFENVEGMRTAGTKKINVLHDISGFDNIGIKGNVTLFEGMSVTGVNSIKIGENSTLNLRLTDTFSGNLADAEFDDDEIIVTRPSHALQNNGEKLVITGEGTDKDTIGSINFITDNIGKRAKLDMKDIYIENLYIRASSAIDSAIFNEGKELILSAGTSLDDLHLDKIYKSEALDKPEPPSKPSKKRYNSLNNIYKGIYSSKEDNLNALRVLISSNGKLGNNYDENLSDEEQLKNLMSYLGSIYTETPYSFSSELSRKSAGMFRDIVTENQFRSNLNRWLIMGGLTHRDGGTKDSYYGQNYHEIDTGTADVDMDMKLTGAYALGKYGYSENVALGVTVGGNKSEAKLPMSKVKGNSGYIGAFAENYRGNLTLKAGAGIQYSEYDANRATLGGHSYNDKYSDMAYDIYLNGRYSHNIGNNLFLEPYGTLSYTYVDQEGTDEGNKALAIETDSKSFDYTAAKVGVDLKKVIPHEKGKSTLSAGVSYTRLLNGADEENITGRFKGKDASDFDILVAHKNEHSIGLNAKYALELENGILFDVKGSYNVERDSHNGNGKNRNKGEWIVGAGLGYKF